MTFRRFLRRATPVAAACLVLAGLLLLGPAAAHAAPLQQPPLPGWLEDVLNEIIVALVKTLQDSARTGGVLLWGVLKVCGMVGLFGDEFSALFGTVVTEALNAIVSGSLHDLLRGSLMVSLGIFGLSLLARPFWPDLRLVSFQRAALWGMVIQAYLLNAPTVYTELETWRVGLAEQAASAVSTGAVPGCSGDVVEVLLCITGTRPAEVLDPDLATLPDGLPYGGSESVRDLYDHCVYNPPALYGDPACDPDNPVGDPWEVLASAQDGLGAQLLALILALLILAYGVLQVSLGLAAGMMFVLFPVAAIFAFYLPLESFPAGVIRNYINIFLKSVVLLTLAGVVIRLFSIATGSLASMAAVALVDLLLCLVMAKEALSSLLSSVSFIGSSVGTLGAAFGLSGAGGGAAALPSAESRVAASMVGGGTLAQTAMGAASPYPGSMGNGGIIGAAGRAMGAPAESARAALGAALAAGTGGAGAVVGALAAARGADYGSLALMGDAATTILGRDAGRGFVTGAGLAATRQQLIGDKGVDSAALPSRRTPAHPAQPSLLVPEPSSGPGAAGVQSAARPARSPSLLPADPATGAPASAAPLQSLLLGDGAADLAGWTAGSRQQIRQAAGKLEPASPAAENAAFDLAAAGHKQAQAWAEAGRSPVRADGHLDPQFVEEVVRQEPEPAATLVAEQATAHVPEDERLSIGEAVALGVTTQRTLPASQVRRGFARAVKAAGRDGDLDTALQGELGIGSQAVFGGRAEQAR
ncbi:MAG TPA: hypothetical protein VLC52_11825, partial [Anaerolineae bacterium]|nr:hypothetical protein [Anaerolineae bacterium]